MNLETQVIIKGLLHDRFTQAKQKNPHFSLRAFAKKVDIHFATLSGILNGRRKISQKLGHQIVDKLGLDPQTKADLFSQFAHLTTKGTHYQRLSDDQEKVMLEWEHSAILALLDCEEFQSDFRWIGKRLNISPDRAQRVVERLVALRMIEVSEEGEFQEVAEGFRSSDDVSNITMRQATLNMMKNAQTSLQRDPVEVRDFTYTTFAVNPKNLAKAKEQIRVLQDAICDGLEEGEKTEVYCISMQLFPLTQVQRKSPLPPNEVS